MEKMLHHRRDTPGYIPMTSSSQWSGYLRSTLAELAIKESGDESEGAAAAAEQSDRDVACYSARCEPENRPGSSRSPGWSRKDTPAYTYNTTRRMKSAFNGGVAESSIPEEAETKTEEKSTKKLLKSKRKKPKQKQKQKQGEAANTAPKTPRRKICVGPTEAPAFDHLTETCTNDKSKKD